MLKRKPVAAMVGDHPVRCLICGGEEFWDRSVQLNTSGLEFLGIEWANAAATGLICTECGYVHEFAGNAIQLYKTG
jgi:predicted nucleic-acid-binding Zn-ribbon protein